MVPMTAVEYDRAIDVFQHLHAVDVVGSSHVCRNFAIDGGGNVHRHHAARIVISIVAELLFQRLAVFLIDIATRTHPDPRFDPPSC